MLSKLPAAAGPSGASFSPTELSLLLGKLLSWPRDQLFPALDVARMAALDSAAATALAAQPGEVATCNTAIAELLLPMCSMYHSCPALLACAAWEDAINRAYAQ